jgi:hypothetical protein
MKFIMDTNGVLINAANICEIAENIDGPALSRVTYYDGDTRIQADAYTSSIMDLAEIVPVHADIRMFSLFIDGQKIGGVPEVMVFDCGPVTHQLFHPLAIPVTTQYISPGWSAGRWITHSEFPWDEGIIYRVGEDQYVGCCPKPETACIQTLDEVKAEFARNWLERTAREHNMAGGVQ